MTNKSIKFKLFKNIGAVSLINFLNKFVTIITGISLARLLSPFDFGVFGLASSVMAIILIFDEMGLKTAVIQKKTEYEENVFYTGLFMKSALSVIIFLFIILLIAPISANFYDTPDVNEIMILLALTMLINNFKFIPETRIIKSNHLEKLIAPSIAENISYSVSVILLALMGFNYWSFAYARIISSIIGAISFYFVFSWKPRLIFNKQIGKELFHFSKHLLIACLLSMAITQIDNLIAGKLLGLAILGYYTMAYRWGGIITLDIGATINRVLFPLNVQYQDDMKMIEKIQAQSIKYSSLLLIPMSTGFALICPELVRLVLGEKWEPYIVPLQILAIHSLFWAFLKRGNLFESLGKPQYITYLALINISLIVIFIFPLTIRLGITGTALAVLISKIFSAAAFLCLFCRLGGFNMKSILRKLSVPAISSLIMFAGVYLVKLWLYKKGLGQLGILFISIATGLVIYATCIYLLMQAELRNIVSILRIKDIPLRERFKEVIISL
jgi:O-antigen/teichoic acid export membrane protein